MKRFRDNRVKHIGVVRDGVVVSGSIGGWGPWTVDPPLAGFFADGGYVSTPLPMTQKELRAQYDWAMQRSDRKRYRPEVVNRKGVVVLFGLVAAVIRIYFSGRGGKR